MKLNIGENAGSDPLNDVPKHCLLLLKIEWKKFLKTFFKSGPFLRRGRGPRWEGEVPVGQSGQNSQNAFGETATQRICRVAKLLSAKMFPAFSVKMSFGKYFVR